MPTIEGTVIRITAKEVRKEKFFCYSFIFLSFFAPSKRGGQSAGLRGRPGKDIIACRPQSVIRIKHKIT